MRYFIRLAYDGSEFHGWQSQVGQWSVQECIETKLGRLFSEDRWPIVGCGRTDAGVHARNYYAHFETKDDLPYNESDLVYKLNKMLPDSIAIYDIYKVAEDLHARYDALDRTYQYYIRDVKNPFKSLYSTYYRDISSWNWAEINHFVAFLIRSGDFSSLSRSDSDVNTYNCHVISAYWSQKQGDYIFHITANRFLRGMVRLIIGCCVNIGRNNVSSQHVIDAIVSRQIVPRALSAAPQGLFLENVRYALERY